MADTSLSEKKIGLLIWHVSNYWQSKLRSILNEFNISLNEYLILEAIFTVDNNLPSQTQISFFAGIDITVVSVCLKSLEKKKIIQRKIDKDNRKKLINILPFGKQLFNEISPKIIQQESDIFDKLSSEKNNFSNLLKLVLGKKIRIKAKNIL